ncbi:YbaK/EbsC family protein [soil metagenome]
MTGFDIAGDRPPLPASVQRVVAALIEARIDTEVVMLAESARTAQQAADILTRTRAVPVDVAQIAKSLVFKAQSGLGVLVIASGSVRVDERKVEAELGEPIGRADAAFVREVTGFAIGGVPPLGHAQPLAVLFDRNLLAQPTVWAAAGHPHSLFEIAPQALQRAARARVADIALVA